MFDGLGEKWTGTMTLADKMRALLDGKMLYKDPIGFGVPVYLRLNGDGSSLEQYDDMNRRWVTVRMGCLDSEQCDYSEVNQSDEPGE